MKYIWDRRKNETNVKKHELDFADAYKVFESPMLVDLDKKEEYGDERWIDVGLMENRVVVVVFTELDENTIRIISFRKATSREREYYEQEYKNQFGSV